AGEQQLQAVGEFAAIGEPAAVACLVPRRPGRLDASLVLAGAGDDVDGPEKGAGAVEGGTWPADHLDPLNQVDIEGEVGPYRRLVVDVVVEPVAVDEQQHAAVVVAGAAEPPDSQVLIVAVVDYGKAPDTAEDVGEGAVTVLFDVVGGDDADRRRGVRHLLVVPAGAVHGGHFDVHELFDTHGLNADCSSFIHRFFCRCLGQR